MVCWHQISKKETAKESKLNMIVPTLEKMDSLLGEQALKEAKKPFDVVKYANLNNRINAEILGISSKETKTPEMTMKAFAKMQSEMIRKFGDRRQAIRLQIASSMSGVFDEGGFGLKKYKKQGQYKKLMRNLTASRDFVMDNQLNKLIKEHITSLETLNNMLLAKERGTSIKANYENKEYGVMDFINISLVGAIGMFENYVREHMIEIRVSINKRIHELERENEV